MSAVAKLNAFPQIKLVVQKGPHVGQRFSFAKDKITIGRSPENDIILVNDPLISRQHAVIQVLNNEIEIINVSSKNSILINNELVNRWKLNNNSTFVLGDTEFILHVEAQQSVVSVAPKLTVVKNEQPKPPQPTGVAAAPLTQPSAFKKPQVYYQNQKASPHIKVQKTNQFEDLFKDQTPEGRTKLVRIGLILVVIIGVIAYLFLGDESKTTGVNTKKSVLTYADEMSMKLQSEKSKTEHKKLEDEFKKKQAPLILRSEEYYSMGMKDYRLGKYSNAIESFQQALILNREHELAKRYLRLSTIRFDEVVQAKLQTAQSYYESNNFKLCYSLNKQVVEMLSPKDILQGDTKNINLQLAERMMKKCEFATEGIR